MTVISSAVLQVVKHHPASVDLELVKRLVLSTKANTLQGFLYKEFACISKDYAGRATTACVLKVMLICMHENSSRKLVQAPDSAHATAWIDCP